MELYRRQRALLITFQNGIRDGDLDGRWFGKTDTWTDAGVGETRKFYRVVEQ